MRGEQVPSDTRWTGNPISSWVSDDGADVPAGAALVPAK
jgi:hypothetical protein